MEWWGTHHPLWASVNLGELLAGVADGWRVYERRDFRHMLQAEPVEHVRVLGLEVR